MSVTLEERLNAYGPVLDRAMADDLIERAADLSSERARPRRSSRQLIVAVVVVAVACIAAVGVALTEGHSSNSTTATTTVVTPEGEHASQAAANAALLPLADLPAGTLSQTPAKPSNVSCTSTPLVKKPRFFAVATYLLPRSSTRLNDGVNIYAPGGAAQTMRNVREQWNCPVATDPNFPDERWSVATLNFPSIAPGQLSYGFQHSYAAHPGVTTTITNDVLVLPVNSSSVLVLIAESTSNSTRPPNLAAAPPIGPGVADLSAFEDFARKAWTRAELTLGR
jgi:hypothetical protein